MRSIPRCEQETIIRWAADETMATISTSNPVVIRKLDKLTEAAPDDYKKLCELDDNHDARYTMSADLIQFRRRMQLTDAQIAKRAEGAKAARAARLKTNSEHETLDDLQEKKTSSAAVDSLPTPTNEVDEMHMPDGAKHAESKDGKGARA